VSQSIRHLRITIACRPEQAIQQEFHDVKEVRGIGQQQVRNIWNNVAAFNLNVWMQTLVECWAWHKPAEEIRDRSDSPWDDPASRPSHADRRKVLHRQDPPPQKIRCSPPPVSSSQKSTLPQPNAHPPTPIAQAPNPIGVINRSELAVLHSLVPHRE
jgi:hypothetical protein